MCRIIIRILLVLIISIPYCHAQDITTFAGNGNVSNDGDSSLATLASINYPIGGVFDKFGNYYFALGISGNTIRKIAPSGIITTVCGITGQQGFSGDGGLATQAELRNPQAVTVDTNGNLYIADANNNRIRKVDVSTGIISTYAGIGIASFGGDNGLATSASISNPLDLCFDKYDNLYIADWGNARVRKVSTDGIITTFAGTGVIGYNGDNGLADTSEINQLFGLCADTNGNIYIADDAGRVRKITTDGIIHTIAGIGQPGYSGDGGPAISAKIVAEKICIDNAENIFITEGSENRVRKIDATSGFINTVVGGTQGFGGDGGFVGSALINIASGVTTDTCGNLFIADKNNHRIRKITYSLCDTTHSTIAVNTVYATFAVYPNPAINEVTIQASTLITDVAITNLVGQSVYHQTCNARKVDVNIATLPRGVYFVKVNGQYVQKLLKE